MYNWSCRYEQLNRKALLDANLYARTGRVRTPSPKPVSDDDLEIIEIDSESGGCVLKPRQSGSAGICRCKEATDGSAEAQLEVKKIDLNWEAHWVLCVGEDAEDEQRSLGGPVDTDTTASPTKDSEHDTYSDFLPSDAELVSEGICTTFESEDVSVDGTGNSQEEATDDSDGVPDQVKTAVHF